MFEKFTDSRARKVMVLANQEACRCNHEYVDTGHLLIALLKEGSGIGATVLKDLGADLLRMRSELEKIDKPGPDMVTTGKLPQTPQAKKAIEYTVEEARSLKHNYLGTEHILLGLLRQPERGKFSTANKILRNLKIKPKEVREEVMNLLGETGEKKERPVNCEFFEIREFVKEPDVPVDEKFEPDIVKAAISEFLTDKEYVGAAQSSAIFEKTLPPLIITKITIYFREKS